MTKILPFAVIRIAWKYYKSNKFIQADRHICGERDACMKAQNLTISIPYKGCDKNCPYCVSMMTGYDQCNRHLMKKQLPKVLTLARMAGISSVLLSGKGEPLLNLPDVQNFISEFREFPVELQTNGLLLTKEFDKGNHGMMLDLCHRGLNVLAFSLDTPEELALCKPVFAYAAKLGIVLRVTWNVSDLMPADIEFDTLVDACLAAGARQMTLRHLTVPKHVDVSKGKAKEASQWIEQHHCHDLYARLTMEMADKQKVLLRRLPYGAEVFDYKGLSVTCFDYCVQDNTNTLDIRSLIFAEDGHVYTAWNSRASLLF